MHRSAYTFIISKFRSFKNVYDILLDLKSQMLHIASIIYRVDVTGSVERRKKR